jgi:hypothetical protein
MLSGRPDATILFYTVGMKYFKDPVLLGLVGLLALTVTLFLAGVLPYPFGILVLLIFIVARILYRL